MPESFICLTVPGKPVPKGRPRFTVSGHVYTPERTVSAESIMQALMSQACPKPLEGPLELVVSFLFRRPDSWPKARRDAVDDGAEPWYIGKPDLDNLCKLVKDAGNHVLWQDDSQIVSLEANKVYSAENATVINLMGLR